LPPPPLPPPPPPLLASLSLLPLTCSLLLWATSHRASSPVGLHDLHQTLLPFAHRSLSRLQPWSRLSEALLKPLPADWRYNIQQAFSQLGDALAKFMGDGQQKQRVGGVLKSAGAADCLRVAAGVRQPSVGKAVVTNNLLAAGNACLLTIYAIFSTTCVVLFGAE
jgi:hypothetical protein